MDWSDWTQQGRLRLRRRAPEGNEEGGRDPLRFARRTLGSFGRGAAWRPDLRGRTFQRTVADLQDWWQMYLDEHPYRLLTGMLAAGFILGYLVGRSTRPVETTEVVETQTRQP